jgi:hypothetical protein
MSAKGSQQILANPAVAEADVLFQNVVWQTSSYVIPAGTGWQDLT